MAVIGTGQAHGACSLLHAAGTGYGAAISLDLPVIVKALDRPSKRELKDPDNLLTRLSTHGLRISYHYLMACRKTPFIGLLLQKYPLIEV